MKMLFLLLAFPFFFKVCTGLLLSGEVGGTVLFQCNSIKKEIKSMSFQGGTDFKKVMIGYHAPTNKTEVLRPDTFLNNVDRTVTFGKLTVSDEGTYKCIINHGVGGGITEDTKTTLSITATPDTVTLERHIPGSAGDDVSNASLTCTAIAVYPVSKISWNVSGVLEHQWENIVTRDKNSLLFNISSTAFFNCSDKSTRLITCSLGGVSSDEKIVCQQPKGPTLLYCLLILIAPVLGGFACWEKCKINPRSGTTGLQAENRCDSYQIAECSNGCHGDQGREGD